MHTFKRILVPTDLSALGNKALSYAVALAHRFDGELHLVHVVESAAFYASFVYDGALIDSDRYVDGLLAARETAFEEFAREIRLDVKKQEEEPTENQVWRLRSDVGRAREELKLRTYFRQGNPATEIVELAKEIDSDLVVLTTHGRTGIEHVLMGSVAERVVRESPCPVLVLRDKSGSG